MVGSRLILAALLGVFGSPLLGQDTLRVVGPAGTPLPFATVAPAGSAAGYTDGRGRYPLPDQLSPHDTVTVSYLGYAPLRRSLADLRRAGGRAVLQPAGLTLTTPTVVGRRDETARALPYAVETVGAAAVDRAQSLTTADALADLSGVYVQKSQFGGGSPVVRGFEANRVLLVVDGVRMNNAIFRSGHLQNAITVDPLALERLEIIYGAGSLAYGSDALGGVVHFRTVRPRFADEIAGADAGAKVGGAASSARPRGRLGGTAAVRYASAARAFGQSVRLAYGARDFATLTLLSGYSTGHLRSGAQRPAGFAAFGQRLSYVARQDGRDRLVRNPDPNRQIGTAYAQFNLLHKMRWRLADGLELDANLQYTTTGDVPRYDALTERRDGELRWARWDYGPQTRALAALRLSDRRPGRWYTTASVLLSHQFTEEDRLRRRFRDDREENSLVDVHATNLQVDLSKVVGPRTTLRYGGDVRYDRVESRAFLLDLVSRARSPFPSRYPSGGSTLAGAGAYAEAEYRWATAWRVRGGLRAGRQRLDARFGAADPVAWPRDYVDGVGNTAGAVTGALGVVYDDRRHRWRGLVAQGFRAPNVDDFAKFRERNGFVQVPNPELQPERSLTAEVSYGYRSAGGQLALTATAYRTWLRRAIVRGPGRLPDGTATFVSRGDTLRAQTNVNAASARIFGGDLTLRWRPAPAWTVETALHYLRGRRQQRAPDGVTLTLPQDHIPPPYGRVGLGWRHRRLDLRLTVRFQLAKRPEDYAVGAITLAPDGSYRLDRTGTPDNLELTPLASDVGFNYTGTYGWWTANAYAGYELGRRWSLRLKAENLLDRHYRTFASGLSAPGFDAGATLTCTF